jgi:hypothetical protein
MHKLLSQILLLTTTTMAIGQGKLAFLNNSDNLIYFTTDPSYLLPADRHTGPVVGGFALAGSCLSAGAGGTIAALAGSPTIIAGLWAGTSSSSLTLQTTTTIGEFNMEGQVDLVNCTFPSLPANTPAWFQVEVYDSRAANAPAALAAGEYQGESMLFQATPGPAVYQPIYQTQSPVSSTWAPGTQVLTDFVGYPGYFGGIAVWAIPEPGTFALVGLGAAVLMICRRRR